MLSTPSQPSDLPFSIQLVLQVINFLLVFVLLAGTLPFEVGLIGMLVKEFRSVFIVIPSYALAYVAFMGCKIVRITCLQYTRGSHADHRLLWYKHRLSCLVKAYQSTASGLSSYLCFSLCFRNSVSLTYILPSTLHMVCYTLHKQNHVPIKYNIVVAQSHWSTTFC